ncbi:MAG: hypothetical protein ABEH77_09220, partial [Halobacteriaceae archaeon]
DTAGMAEDIPVLGGVQDFVGRRGWLQKLIAVEVVLVIGAFVLDNLGNAVAGTAPTASEAGNAETITIFAAMLGAYALLLGVIGAIALVVSVALAARRPGRVVDDSS